MKTQSTRARAAASVAALALSASALAGCSLIEDVIAPGEPVGNDAAVAAACEIIVTELRTTGLSLADLVPSDLSQVDGGVLAAAYDEAAGVLDRAKGHVSDVRIGDVLDTAAESMQELAPITEAAVSGDPQALLAASGPLADLAGVAAQCAGQAITG